MNRRSLLWVVLAALALAIGIGSVDARAPDGGGGGAASGQGGGGPRPGGGGGGGGTWQGGHGTHWNGGYRGGHYGSGWYASGVGLYFGLPGFWGWPYYDYGYSAPYPVYAPEQTVITVAPSAAAPVTDSPPANFWFYCTEPAGYYPYVQTCNQTWVAVLPESVMPAPAAPTQ